MATSWKKTSELGKGSFGTVYLATDSARRSIAVKFTKMEKRLFLKTEAEFLKEFTGNPYVVQCYGEDVSEEEGGEWVYNLLMEYAPKGSLRDLVQGHGGIMPEHKVAYYSYFLLQGLSEIHRKKMIHCDIKPSNVLVFENRDGLEHLKLADFGTARYECERETGKFRGTEAYGSPESLEQGVHGKASDVWSFGITVLEMMSGGKAVSRKRIWTYDMDSLGLVSHLGLPEIPKYVSEKGKDFLENCLKRDADSRWTAEELLKHPFIQENMSFKSADLIGIEEENPFGCWSSTRGLFSSSAGPHCSVVSEYDSCSKCENHAVFRDPDLINDLAALGFV